MSFDKAKLLEKHGESLRRFASGEKLGGALAVGLIAVVDGQPVKITAQFTSESDSHGKPGFWTPKDFLYFKDLLAVSPEGFDTKDVERATGIFFNDEYYRTQISTPTSRGEPVTRYRTRHYCTTIESEAARLAGIDNTEEIKQAVSVCLLHVTSSWALWSDGKITTAIGLKPEETGLRETLPKSAASFISSIWGSDSDCPSWIGQIADVLEEKEIQIGGERGVYARKKIIRYTLQLKNGEKKKVFVFTVGYFEGYLFDVYETWGEAKAAFNPPPCPHLTCLECGAVYEEPGHVEWGQMECDRCNS